MTLNEVHTRAQSVSFSSLSTRISFNCITFDYVHRINLFRAFLAPHLKALFIADVVKIVHLQ